MAIGSIDGVVYCALDAEGHGHFSFGGSGVSPNVDVVYVSGRWGFGMQGGQGIPPNRALIPSPPGALSRGSSGWAMW